MQRHRTNATGQMLRLEARLFLRQRFVLPALVAFAFLCLFAAAEGMHRIAEQRATIHRLVEAEGQRLAAARQLAQRLDRKQGTTGPFRDPRVPSNFVRLVLFTPAVKPLFPAAALDAAQADILPFYFQLNVGSASKTTTTYEYSNPQQLLLGRFDLSLVLVYILPLFLALFGYRVGSFEREAGITPLLKIACPRVLFVYARRLLLASLPIIAVYLAVAVSVTCVESHIDRTGVALLLRTLAVLVVLVASYSTFWICVLLLLTRTRVVPAAALLRMSMVWLAACLLIPACANQLAAAVYPTMSRPEYVNRVRAVNDALTRDPGRLYALYLAKHPGLADAPAPMPGSGSMTLITAEMTDGTAEKVDGEIKSTQLRQDRVTQWLAIASPALLLQRQLDRLAGEDLARQQLFVSAAKQHIQKLRDFYRDPMRGNKVLSDSAFEHLTQYPRFQ